jgi:ATP-dependent DNA helicase RecG
LAQALVGGDDPSKSASALEDADRIAALYAGSEQERVTAFVAALKNPGAIPGVSRAVVLARGQRFLLGLAMEIEDALSTPATKTSSDEKKSREPPATPFDPALLALPGIGPKSAARLASRGLTSPVDLLFLLPRRYDDRRRMTPMGDVREGERVVTAGAVKQVRVFGRPWKQMMEMVLEEEGAELAAVWFSNRRPRSERFEKGDRVMVAGLVSRYRGRLQIAHPQVAVEGEDTDLTGRVVPIYPEVPDVAGRAVEKAVRAAAARAETLILDPLPDQLLASRGLLPLAEALRLVHLPPEDVSAEALDAWINGASPAHRRLIYDEFFFIQLALALRRKRRRTVVSPALPALSGLADELGARLGFTPTVAQARVIAEIAGDLATTRPMQRLLQGDVGSGKTFVALAAMVQAVRAGHQTALMAPTEILAEQHMRTLSPVLGKLGIRAVLHMGSARSSTRKKNLAALARGTAHVAIGTHALLQESVQFFKLSLAIVDEQHRFGVSQRLGLVGKGPDGETPHLLVMTATPIPRTLALTVHGDLDIAILDERPPGRVPVATHVWSQDERVNALSDVAEALARGEQAYVVCPLIEESERLDLRAVAVVVDEMKARFEGYEVGVMHGRLSDDEKERVMAAFLSGQIALLVTTTVVEVGVDVPNATVMLVEGAERFGLAQLHQLRGRVGRSDLQSCCHLVVDPKNRDARTRLAVLAHTDDGFEVAEQDLLIRGPGELYGRRQAGLPGFRFGHLVRDAETLVHAREDVQRLLAGNPSLEGSDLARLKAELQRRLMAEDAPVGEEAG